VGVKEYIHLVPVRGKPAGCERELLYGLFAIAPRVIQSRIGTEEQKERQKKDGRNSRKRETRKETHIAMMLNHKRGKDRHQHSVTNFAGRETEHRGDEKRKHNNNKGMRKP
jgi:hypothetical protein